MNSNVGLDVCLSDPNSSFMAEKSDIVIAELDLPEEVKEWASTYKTPQELWRNCRRADWMLMVLERSKKGSWRGLRHFLVALARRHQLFLPDIRSARALELAEKYADGDATQGAVEFILEGAEKATQHAVESGWTVTAYAARLTVLSLGRDTYASCREAIDISINAAIEMQGMESEALVQRTLAEMAVLLRENEPAPFG